MVRRRRLIHPVVELGGDEFLELLPLLFSLSLFVFLNEFSEALHLVVERFPSL